MRSLLRAMLAVLLLLGGGAAGWMSAPTEAHESCCCGMPTSSEDTCPCPKPESNRGPQRSACPERQVVVATLAARRVGQGQRRTEPRPEPAGCSLVRATDLREDAFEPQILGRVPDLGQHLARLNTFRI